MLESLKLEKEIYVGWARRVVRDSSTDAEAVRTLMMIASDREEADPTPAITREQIHAWLDATSKDYDELFTLYDLPQEEYEARWQALQDRLEDGNPYSRMVLPGLKSIRDVRDRNTASWALFRVAMAIVRDGASSLDTMSDPFGDGPFQYAKLDGGFRLTSQFKFRGEPVELTVGQVKNQ